MASVADDDLTAAAARLLAKVAADAWGSVSPSTYETGRLVAIAPWLIGHASRVEYLCRTQDPDGSWGGPEGYAVVPTLSATAALWTELARDRHAGHGRTRAVEHAAQAGLRAVRRWLEPDGWLHPDRAATIPDTVAVELMVPALWAELRGALPIELSLPSLNGFDQRLDAMRTRMFAGPPPPEPVHHVLELLGPAAKAAAFARPSEGGIGASAAATATWLGGPDGPRPSREFLEQLQARGAATVPNVTPITYFEGAWVLNNLAVGGVDYQVPAEILDRLEAGLGDAGCPAGPGLPVDADDTAGVLAALLRHGRLRSPEPLLGFRSDGYFQCFVGERNRSVSTNAHVLEALSLYLALLPKAQSRFSQPADATAGWLLDQQSPDGSWWDKWHASPYYATYCCVLALAIHGGCGAPAAIDRAVAWVLGTQRADGGWGRWRSTAEETAYASYVLAHKNNHPVAAAAERGARFLASWPSDSDHPPLWHGKDLYTPMTVVQAARIGALGISAAAVPS